MSDDNVTQLRTQFPELFGDVYIGVGDGWFNLLHQLSMSIVNLCTERGIEIPKVIQVKEKFGGLRFYIMGSPSDELNQMIYRAERDSFSICERCGGIGNQTDTGWVRTLCDECRVK